MAIAREHIPYYREIFKLPGFWQEPFLMIGLQDINGKHIPKDFRYKTLKDLLYDRDLKNVNSLDLYDQRADLKYDLNKPIPSKYKNKYKVLIEIGTLEHIFDTRICLENYFSMIKTNGLFVLVTPVNGYFDHGLHVFNPESIKSALNLNNFKILWQKYSSSTGIEISDPSIKKNVLIWIVAKKEKAIRKFVVPQQKMWKKAYKKGSLRHLEANTIFDDLKFLYREAKRYLINKLPKNILNSLYGRF